MGAHRTPEQLKSEIVNGTLQIVAEGGIVNFSFPKLTAKTGISAPTVYEHYKNKEDLLVTCYKAIDCEVADCIEKAIKAFPTVPESAKEIQARFRFIWQSYWDFLTSNRNKSIFYWYFLNSGYYTHEMQTWHRSNYKLIRWLLDSLKNDNGIAECNTDLLTAHLINATAAYASRMHRGFYIRNGGSITASGYIASRNARKNGNGGEEYIFGNPELYISDDTPKAEICRRLGLDGIWKNPSAKNGGFIPDIAANRHEISACGETVRLETAQDIKNMIETVNSGDKNAAGAHYILACDINMRGAKLKPIGDSENYPFRGKFDGNGKTISNFTVDCRGAEYGGFFGCTENAEVANLALDYILKGSGGVNVGGMAGNISGGNFTNCQVRLSMSPGMCSGGFCGKNSGVIRCCYAGGKIAPPQ